VSAPPKDGLAPPNEAFRTAAAIVARIPYPEAAEELVAEFQADMSTYELLSDEAQAVSLAGFEANLTRWWRFLSTGEMPPNSEFDRMRAWTRARARDGARLEDLLGTLGLGHQLGWQLVRRHTRSDEAEGLVAIAESLAQYLARVSAIVTETYMAERELLVSEEERSTRSLLERLCVDTPLDPPERELADGLGVPLQPAYSPFAVVMPGRPPHRHAALAARLRQGGLGLAVTQGERVVGLTWRPLDLPDLDEGADVLLAVGEPTRRDELAAAREELAVLVAHGRAAGLRGRLTADHYVLEILLGRSPRLHARLRDRILTPLADDDHGELAETLRALLRCDLDRMATSSQLHIHRNTLAYRLGRIEEITGLDLGDPRDLASAYLALEVGSAAVSARAPRSAGGDRLAPHAAGTHAAGS
jgi:hypothetical protein